MDEENEEEEEEESQEIDSNEANEHKCLQDIQSNLNTIRKLTTKNLNKITGTPVGFHARR
jgi:AraC-like DNA-binding protein